MIPCSSFAALPSLCLCLQLVLPAGLLDAGLLHLLALSTSYRDVSCEDLSEVTWEQLTRKLGLVVEVRVGRGGWGGVEVRVGGWEGAGGREGGRDKRPRPAWCIL